MRLDHKIAIVTGGASGFGAGIARRFAEEGARIVVNDVNAPGAQAVAAAINAAGGRAAAFAGDVSKDQDVDRLVRFALAEFGGLNVIVNNAGTTHRNQPMLDVSEEAFDRIYQVNVKGLYLTAKHAVPHFRAQHDGVFITIASTAGVRPRPGLTWYNGSKGAAIITSRSMAAELAPHNIRVNCVAPGAVEGDRIDRVIAGQAEVRGIPVEAMRKAMIERSPLKRMVTADDIVDATVFFTSDMARSISGQVLAVNAGEPAG